ncbi:membrane dipeptidase [Flavihumibacter fluvii]|uniref:membrane dipeptidase n=1 Tax=Flavihumibacter fluvii TaxID=2838157 RepID=UPI001BDF6381|nr:membrane dipeptidase [Flavihumibacter fluvii]ULQ54498.1 dipeptidase [Flavihumibacter fluvii]
MLKIPIADIHCHPNLKPYGHSFTIGLQPDPKSNVWYHQPLTQSRLRLKNALGISAYSQADFTAMCNGGVKLAIVSLYPFEKGFFNNLLGNGSFSAGSSNLVTGIGYHRVRFLQKNVNYFEDLEREYTFFCQSVQHRIINDQFHEWSFIGSASECQDILRTPNKMGVVYSIEGAHVFNSGLHGFGRKADETEIVENIRKVKAWKYPPLFITFAHNFYNELCGHSRSLETLGPIVDQSEGINSGFTKLGIRVLHELLDDSNGKPVLIDVKHMSLNSRETYYRILQEDYDKSRRIPIIVSHGGVTGTSYKGKPVIRGAGTKFYNHDINFYDEELVMIAASGGLFAIQLDTRRLASRSSLKEAAFAPAIHGVSPAAWLVWAQLRHIAEVADAAFLPAWDIPCIGSDFEGTINPPIGCLSAEDYNKLGGDLVKLAASYCSERKGKWNYPENEWYAPEEIIAKFAWRNASSFIEAYFNS